MGSNRKSTRSRCKWAHGVNPATVSGCSARLREASAARRSAAAHADAAQHERKHGGMKKRHIGEERSLAFEAIGRMHVAHQLWDTALLFQGGGSRGMAQFRTGFARPASGQGSWGAADGRGSFLKPEGPPPV